MKYQKMMAERMTDEELLSVFDFDSMLDGEDMAQYEGIEEERPRIPEYIYERIRHAAAVGDLPAIEAALEKYNGDKQYLGGAVSEAIANGQHSVVEFLLSCGVPFSQHFLTPAMSLRDTKVLEIFLRHGWDINEPESVEVPPQMARAVNDIDLTKWFLQNGAKPDAASELNVTPLTWAVNHGTFEVIKTMFENGGSVRHGYLLHSAVGRKLPDSMDVIKLIINKGININEFEPKGTVLYHWKKFTGLGTPLHRATANGNVEAVRLLLGMGANTSTLDARERTALDVAEEMNSSWGVDNMAGKKEQIINLLKEAMPGHEKARF